MSHYQLLIIYFRFISFFILYIRLFYLNLAFRRSLLVICHTASIGQYCPKIRLKP